jgi:hypothetical protein
MPFGPKVKEEALVKSARRCCICHVFAGRDAGVHHIDPESESGPDTIDNAIVLCPRCHGEAGHYNPKHPIGNRYSKQELKRHRDLWWEACERTRGISSPEDPICVSPNRVVLGGAGWQTFQQFVVSNRTHDPYWQIWTKITQQPSALDLENLKISVAERSPAGTRFERFGDSTLDPVQIVTHDEKGQQLKYLMINSLRPSDYFYFNIVLSPLAELKERVELFIDLWSFETAPSTWGYKAGQPSLHLDFPQPLRGPFHISLSGSYRLQE